MFSLPATKRPVALSCTIAQAVPRMIVGDMVRLRQILLNLLGNALKFTEQGHVELLVELRQPTSLANENGRSNALDTIHFSVLDSGIGIPKELQNRLFQPFSQIDASTTRRFGGSGLGLVISKLFIQRMGGEISVESEEGVGSTFHFYIQVARPIPKPTLQPVDEETIPSIHLKPTLAMRSPLRILLAEDNLVNRKVALLTLQRLGYQPDFVTNGAEVIQKFSCTDPVTEPVPEDDHTNAYFEQECHYDIILMDIQMPLMDGVEATAHLRQQLGERCPFIIAMTANAIAGDREKYLQAGMDDYIGKPFQIDDLASALERAYLHKTQVGGTYARSIERN